MRCAQLRLCNTCKGADEANTGTARAPTRHQLKEFLHVRVNPVTRDRHTVSRDRHIYQGSFLQISTRSQTDITVDTADTRSDSGETDTPGVFCACCARRVARSLGRRRNTNGGDLDFVRKMMICAALVPLAQEWRRTADAEQKVTTAHEKLEHASHRISSRPHAGRCGCGNRTYCQVESIVHDKETLATPESSMTALIASASGWNRSAVSGIPKIVHQTWKGCASSLPSKQARWREGCMRVNPGWSFWLWNDEDNRRLIADHYPSFLKMYDSYDVKMKRVDAARLFYLHRFGGIYMDLDFACLRSFEELPMPSHDAVFSHQYANTAAKDPRAGVAGTIATNFMVAAPDHPFFAYAIHKLPTKADRSLLFATGPNFLSRIISEYQDVIRKQLGTIPAHVTVYKMPKVYATGWKGKNPCESGMPEEVERCSAVSKASNGSILATFWTQTWKYNPDSMTIHDAKRTARNSTMVDERTS